MIAGPRIQPEEGELQAIEDHLRRGGAVLALFDPGTPSRWVEWMRKWRVGLTDLVLVTDDPGGQGFGVSARTMVVAEGYGDHEISRPCRGWSRSFPWSRPWPRSVSRTAPSPGRSSSSPAT